MTEKLQFEVLLVIVALMKHVSEYVNALKDKRVIIRTNFDVPLIAGKVSDDTRIIDTLDTINLARQHAKQVILIAHLGRPNGSFDKNLSLEPVAKCLIEHHVPVELVNFAVKWSDTIVPNLSCVMLENIRFYKEEEFPTDEFTSWLSSITDVYINECFATCHRDHTSITKLAQKIPAFAGTRLSHEVKTLQKVRLYPDKPLVVVMGGAKLETKLPLIKYFLPHADSVLVGGKLAIELNDHPLRAKNLHIADLTSTTRDITKESAKSFATRIHSAKTVIWNGTMGVVEEPDHQLGTKIIAQAVNETKAFTIVGGGDTEAALTLFNLESNIDHISSGGGAMLEFLSTGTLIGLKVLGYEV
jgi:phosphoglycerate kinase